MSTKITALPASAGLVLTDIFPVVDDPGGVPVTQKATFAQLQTLLSTGGPFVLKAGDTMTGALVHPDGTAALPSITFTGDLDTGIYRPAANTIGLSAGGALTLAVSATGINLTTALAYQYNGSNVIRAITAANNYFFGPSGNLTMTGADNTSVGANSFLANTSGDSNVAVGIGTLQDNTTGSGNSAIGYFALGNNISGIENVSIGNLALFLNTSGDNNLAIGQAALFSNVSGDNNVAFGFNSLFSATGSSNTGAGYRTLFNLTTGIQNTALGFDTGQGITTGSNNTILGANVTGLAAALTGTIILATGAGTIRFYSDSAGLSGIATAVPNSTLHVQGSLALAYVAKTAVYTATVSDYTIDCTANTFDVDLPTAVGITGRIYVIKNSGAGVITIDPSGAETIDGAATATVVAGASVTTQSTGAGWIII